MVALAAAGVGSAFAADAHVAVIVQVGAIAALIVVDRAFIPYVDRWRRGARGEEHVGAVIAALADAGWLGLHDVDLGRGNVDHVLVGPGGVLTVETKSHGGNVSVDRVDERMLRQAYAQPKALDRVTETPVSQLLVFRRAFLDRPVSRRRGVTILPARLLAGHLARRPAALSPDEVQALHARLVAALAS